jgi:uncharacterized membrane protein YtjA (UPF0391 family)
VRTAGEQSNHDRKHKQDEKDEEEELGNAGKSSRNTTESEDRRDDRQNEETCGPAEHAELLFRKTVNAFCTCEVPRDAKCCRTFHASIIGVFAGGGVIHRELKQELDSCERRFLMIACSRLATLLRNIQGRSMLVLALVFFLLALVAFVLGFGGVALAGAGVAKLLFLLFIVLFVVSGLSGVIKNRPPV